MMDYRNGSYGMISQPASSAGGITAPTQRDARAAVQGGTPQAGGSLSFPQNPPALASQQEAFAGNQGATMGQMFNMTPQQMQQSGVPSVGGMGGFGSQSDFRGQLMGALFGGVPSPGFGGRSGMGGMGGYGQSPFGQSSFFGRQMQQPQTTPGNMGAPTAGNYGMSANPMAMNNANSMARFRR